MSLRIALVGAGSREFGPATIGDLLLSDPLCEAGVRVALTDPDEDALARTVRTAGAMARSVGRELPLESTTDPERALSGADFVVMAIERRRYFYWSQDFHIPRKLGFRQIYGENGGPGGLFHALRNVGPCLEIARTMERVCPAAVLLNYTNPLTKLCQAQTTLSGVRVVGLCHGVFAGMAQVARLLDRPTESIEFAASGLNHITWFQTLRDRDTGEDLYPELIERESRAHWLHDWDEIALSRTLLRAFGLYPSPGTNHIGEYLGWAEDFLASTRLQFFHDPREGDPWSRERIPPWIYHLGDHPTDTPPEREIEEGRLVPSRRHRDADAVGAGGGVRASGELAVPVIEGLACGVSRELASVNVPNSGGYVPGLPADAVVEVPARVGPDGLEPTCMPALPEPVLAILRTMTSIHRLLIEAVREESRDRVLQALLLDPTTPSYAAAVHVIDELCALQADVLPPLRWARGGSGA